MRLFFSRLVFGLFVFLLITACAPQILVPAITILDGDQRYTLNTTDRIPANVLAQVGITLAPADRILFNGTVVPSDQPLPENSRDTRDTLQVRRAVSLTMHTSDGNNTLPTAAFTVGQALSEAGIQLFAADFMDPPAETPITGPLEVTYRPARELSINVDGQNMQGLSSAASVGQALAELGIPLQGLDYSLPAESDPLPADGLIRLVRIQESVLLVQKPLPYETEFQASADLELDRQDILQPGQFGLSMSRVRIRYEDGEEVSRLTESEGTIRQPKTRVIGYGTRIVTRTANVAGATIEYWRLVKMYATSYSPCRSAPDRCYPSTASGKPVKKGVVAVVYRWYVYMQGQPVYIPGYGYATIEDVGGGIPGKNWIDLGYSDSDWQQWGDWVTVYFLTPVPANPLFVLD